MIAFTNSNYVLSISRGLAILLLTLASAVAQAQTTSKIFTLKYRQATILLPALEPFVANDGAISSLDNKLIVQTSSDNMKSIAKLIKKLDLPLQQLLISVSFDADNIPKANLQRDSKAISITTHSNKTLLQTIQVLEGETAHFQRDRHTPVLLPFFNDLGIVSVKRGHQEESQGFYATVKLRGQNADIELIIETSAIDLAVARTTEHNRVKSTITTPLNSWKVVSNSDLARVHVSPDGSQFSTYQRNSKQPRVAIKVQKAK